MCVAHSRWKETTMPRNPVVDDFLTNLNHPYKPEIEKLREIILGANRKIEEDIKWKCPTFVYHGNLASIVVRTKSHVQLMFHTGATLPDDTGLLEGDGPQVRFARFQNMAEVRQKRKALEAVVRKWVKMKSTPA
jgi:uncharacterized protein YdeI (YjbR/CyaY-like superfamily)